MENASKALIIAGAILLSILIISLGIMVYNNAKNTVGSANLSKQEIEAFNSQWQSYLGENKTASEVEAMMSAVYASNTAEEKAKTGRYITITKNSTTPNSAATTSNPNQAPEILTKGSTYTVKAGYKNGLIVGLSYKS